MKLNNNGNSPLVFLDLGMDDEGDDDPVPLPNVNAAILKKVREQTIHINKCVLFLISNILVIVL